MRFSRKRNYSRKSSRKSRRKNSRKNRRQNRKQRGGSWGAWSAYPDATASNTTGGTMPPPLANGGLYTGPQSTGEWASQPFPATQQAWAIEASKVSGIPEVGYYQRPTDNWGANPGPYNSVPLSPAHYSTGLPPQ